MSETDTIQGDHTERRNHSSPYKSQFGEDALLEAYFEQKRGGYYIEVGAFNGIEDSNTFVFEQEMGWRGILIEADPELAEKCRKIRPLSQVYNCAIVKPDSPETVTFEVVDGWKTMSSLSVKPEMLLRVEHVKDRIQVREITVAAMTLDQVLTKAKPPQIDFMTLDIEGFEWDALQGFSLSVWKPQVLIIERNTHYPDAKIMGYLHKNAYRFLRTTGVNDWFVPREKDNRTDEVYRKWLFRHYYLPKYLTFWKPTIMAPLKQFTKSFLIRHALFHKVKPPKK